MAKMPIERIGQIVKAVLVELRDLEEPTRLRVLLELAEPKLSLTDHEKATLEVSGYIRWHTIVHFYSIDCVKAGYLTKSGGRWSLTDQGKAALEAPAGDFIRSAQAKYRAWRRAHPRKKSDSSEEEDEENAEEIVRQISYDQAVEHAGEGIEAHVFSLGPYDFQKLVAELLRGMGYHVRFVAPPGPDGGIDIAAYSDPLGTTSPRIRAQVKHRRDNKVTVKEVRELEGVLRKADDIGLIVSSGGFSSEALREIQVSTKHIETMDLDRLITLWQQHYDEIREQGKALLPLVKVHFLAPAEE